MSPFVMGMNPQKDVEVLNILQIYKLITFYENTAVMI